MVCGVLVVSRHDMMNEEALTNAVALNSSPGLANSLSYCVCSELSKLCPIYCIYFTSTIVRMPSNSCVLPSSKLMRYWKQKTNLQRSLTPAKLSKANLVHIMASWGSHVKAAIFVTSLCLSHVVLVCKRVSRAGQENAQNGQYTNLPVRLFPWKRSIWLFESIE